MRIPSLLVAIALSLELATSAQVVRCAPPMTFPQAQFEVLGSKLPASDYLASLEACLASLSSRPIERPESPWRESQLTAYRKALARAPVDVLVAPFQNQGYGLERTERAVMSADLAYHLDRSLRVADPFLAARALGEGARSYDRDEILALAYAVGAKMAVIGYVGHDSHRRMTVTVEVVKLDPARAAVVEVVQRDWRDVPFSHVDPPFVVFHRMLPSVVGSLPVPGRGVASGGEPVTLSEQVTFPLKEVAAERSPLNTSVGLTVLGALSSSRDERSRERLFERALVASWHLDAMGEATTFLQAYALLNLEHRPAALARIAGSTRPESVALRAILNGDLPGAEAALSSVANPLQRFMLAVHVDDMRHAYDRARETAVAEPETAFGDSADWLALAVTRARAGSVWHVDEAPLIKALLDDLHPVAGLDVRSLFAGGPLVGADPDDVAIDLATIRHLARFVDAATVPVCCSAAGTRVTAWDVASLLEGRGESRIAKYLRLTTHTRAAPETAGAALARYDDLLEGHPAIAIARADYALAMAERSQGDALDNWRRQVRRDALLASHLGGGQNPTAYDGLDKLGIPSPETVAQVDAYGYDYPRRPYWPRWSLREDPGIGTAEDRALLDIRLFEASEYARTEAAAVIQSRAGWSEEQKIRAREDLAVRFIGHPTRPGLISMLQPPREPSDDPIADVLARLEEDPENWSLRLALGRLLIESDGKWQEAADALIAHPPFEDESPPNRVQLSNAAFEAGSIFYFSGQHELAKPFYEIAANLRTGSNASMASEIRLNILAGEYSRAAEGSFVRAQRYPDAYPFRDLLSFLHALGYGEQAWEGFLQVAAAFDNPQVWVSALVGHRRDGLTEPEIRAWLKQPGIRDAKFRSNAFAPRYAVLVNASGHEPPDDLGELVEEIAGEPEARMEGGLLKRPNRTDPSTLEIVPRTTLLWLHPGADDGARIKSEYAFFGSAYASIRHGRFAAAVDEFRAMAAYYPLELEEYSFALPYFAWAAAKTGDAPGLEKALDAYPGFQRPFDFNLARAFFHGARGDNAAARKFLEAALRSHPYTDYRPVLIEYQYAEACEWLFQETEDPAFVDLLLAWLESQQATQPTLAWAYAMEFTYARTAERKRRALAMTLHLDPMSPRIQSATESERREAVEWGERHNPFLQRGDTSTGDESTAGAHHRSPAAPG